MSSLLRLGLITAVSLASTTAFAGEVAYDWFAMDQDNLWLFDRVEDKDEHSLQEIQVTDSSYWGGGWYNSQVAGVFGEIPLFDHVRSGAMYTHDDQYYYRIFDFNAAVGSTWYFRRGACNAYDVEARPSADVDGPTGYYANGGLKRFEFNGHPDPNVRCMVPPVQQMTFSKGVGPVLLEGHNHRADLLFARIHGEVVASGPGETRIDEKGGLRYTMALVDDEIVQSEILHCITTPCITPPATAHLALVVENIGTTVITKQFNNGQRYDFDLFDGKGENVRSWSDGRVFTMALGGYTLEPGDHMTYGIIELPLSNYETDALLYGEHQLVGYELGNIGAPKLSTTIDVVAP